MKTKMMIVLSVLSLLIAASASADSSGNFTYTGTSATCSATPATFNSDTGDFTGATLQCTDPKTGNPSQGCNTTMFTASIQTPNGQGTTLLIRPSLDTGLFTSTKLSTTVNNATADVGIMVCVYVDPTLEDGKIIDPGLKVLPTNCVVYDQRIQQVSNTLFANLATCVPAACSSDADCAALNQGTCNIPPGGTSGTCSGPVPGCNFEILLTTLSAHSFDYVVPVGNGNHNVLMQWAEIGNNNNTLGGNTLSCVGPVTLTVQQVKHFKNDGIITFNSP